MPFEVLPSVIAGFVKSPTNDVEPSCSDGVEPDIITLPVTVKLPVGTITLPYKVCISLIASPNTLDPVELIVVLICNTLIEAVPNTVTLPDTNAEDIVVAPTILALPENIAGPIFVNVDDPDTKNEPDTCKLDVVAYVLLPKLVNGTDGPATP